MGGGTSWEDDVPRQGGRDVLSEVADLRAAGAGNGGTLAEVAEFCQRTHRVRFDLTAATPPSPGEHVSLARGDPPRVVNGGGEIGVVRESSAKALNGCLLALWELEGTIESIDVDAARGVATVTGVR